MLAVGIEGFGRHFVAWNLAACLKAPIYADRQAPYRSWNTAGTVVVFERWEGKKVPVVIVDNRDPVIPIDIWFWTLPPDPKDVELARERLDNTGANAFLVLNGIRQKGLFGERILTSIPWEEQQAQAILMGMPLVALVPPFSSYFKPLLEVVSRVSDPGR